MLPKLSLVAVAAASLAVAALAPTAASACGGHGWQGGWHGGGGGWGGPRFYVGGPAYYGYGYGGCYVRRLVPTPWGPRWRLVNRCYLAESRYLASKSPGSLGAGAFIRPPPCGTPQNFHPIFTSKPCNRVADETISLSATW